MPDSFVVRDFSALLGAAADDERIDLLRAALVIARTEYPALQPAPYVAQVAALAERVRANLPARPDAADFISALNIVLFVEEGFRGNDSDYEDPRNSFLNDVLERKLGIPITLSLVYMEVARQVGFPLSGVGMPGHFLVKHFTDEGQEILIDPYEGGALLSPEDCQARLDSVYDGQLPLQQEFLAAISRRQMLARMLNNLKGIYLETRNLRKALPILDLLLVADPKSCEDLKQRGIVRYNLGQYPGSLEDFESYIRLVPDAADNHDIRQLIVSLRHQLATMN